MKFSVLIAHFNNSEYFKDCYQSLLLQTHENWEAIILDDASDQEQQTAVKNLIEGDHRFTYYENQQNQGVGFTKRKLIELATGEIVGFVDPDDAILPTAIAKSIELFEKNKNAVLTYSRFMSCDQYLKPITPFKSAKQVENSNPYFFNCPIQINHFVCFRKEIYENTEKINPDLKIAEDQDLYLKLYEKGDVIFLDEANYLYRSHSGGISQNEHKKESYELWAKVIWMTMKRRNLKTINGKEIPEKFTNSQEIFDLLSYQNSIPYRLKKKLKICWQSLF